MAEAIAYPVASNLVSKPLDRLFAAIGRQFGYVLCYKSYVENLKKGVKELKAAQERVQHSIQEAKNDGKLIEDDITNWLASVKEEIEKADDLLKRGESAQNACFRGWLPNSLMRHPNGRKVKKITKVIEELFKKSQSPKFQKVYYENSATTARSVDNKEDVLESRAKIMDDVLKAIVDDNVCVIGVWGAGGVGKSKLLEDLEKQVKEKKLFDVIATVKLSRTPDLKEIQGDIAYVLGLKLTNDESASFRAKRLRERIESDPKENILIILDNLWEKLELKEVGIPCGDDNKVRGCKLLLTSRNQNVLRIGMVCDRVFPLKALEHGEAQRLFERIVGDNVNDPNFNILIDGVVRKCGGLPLLILSVAKRLKHGDLIEWRNALIKIEGADVESIVKLNYDDLKDERTKSLFLVCALTSGIISTRDSLVYCMGLGLFKEFSNPIQIARDRLVGDLRRLQDYSLLLEKDDMERFRMHDIFVDVAISMHGKIMDMEWNALVGKQHYGFTEWTEDDLRKCTAISFPHVGIKELPEKLDCPNLRMLLLLENYTSLKIPESFFESMKKLQVLHFAGLSFTSLTSSMQVLEHLKSLSLDGCYLQDVTVIGKLKGLRFLSFAKSSIARLPIEIGELTKLRFLDLTRCFRLKIIAPGTLGSLVNLEELYIDSFHRWEAEDEAPRSNASLAELKNMKMLSTLDIATPHSTSLSSDLPFGNLNKYKIKIGGIQDWWELYKESRTLELELDSSNLLDEVWMQKCLGRTQDLRLDGSRDGRDSIHDLCTEGFQELKHLYVKNNFSFEYVVDSTQCPAFTRLELLVLENLNKLEKICHCCLAPESFSKLKIVKVENCYEFKQLFPSSMKKIFLQLEEIEITGCNLMQQIVVDVEVDEYRDEIDDDANVKSCKLRRLTLQNLPGMMSFCKTEDQSGVFLDGQQVSLPELESLTLSELPKLKEIWNSQFLSDATNLKFFEVEDCASLLSIFPSNSVIKLPNLEAITIERCQLIQEVFNFEGLIDIGNVEILSRLTTITLSGLPKLAYIWNKNPIIAQSFRNLRELKVQNCENLRFLFTSSMAKGLQQIREIKIARCKLMEEIIDMQEEESEESASVITLEFPLLTSLSLEELSNLKTFSYGTHCIHCPILIRMRIFKCPEITTFASFKGKQQMITVSTSSHQAFGGVNSSLFSPILFDQNVLFPSLEELTLVSLGGLMKIWHNELYEESFCKLTSIEVRDCENLSHIFPSTLIERLRSLKMIEVVNCTSLESLIEHVAVNTKTRPQSLVFSGMERVKLQDLPRLNALLTSSSQATLSLPSLTNVSLRNCHRLRYLFTYDTYRTLDKLEMLDVSSCNNMQEVVATKERDERKLKAVKFSHLHMLKLCFLKSLISFSSGSCVYEFPSLINLSISECTKLKAFILRLPVPRGETMNEGSAGFDGSPHSLFDEKVLFPSLKELTLVSLGGLMKIWRNELSEESFCKLASVKVQDCENLSHVFPSTLIERLRSPNMIEVVNCPSLESLIEHVAVNTMTRPESLVFSGMKGVKLQGLPRLNALLTSSSQATLSLPSLTNVSLSNCHCLRYLFTYDTSKTLDKLVTLDVSGCNNMQQVVATEESDERKGKAVKFSHLCTLKLRSLKSLISFGSESCAYEFPSLKNLSILECTELKAFILRLLAPRGETMNEGFAGFDESPHSLFDEKVVFPKLEKLCLTGIQSRELWENEMPNESVCQLKVLEVKQCPNLLNVIPSFMWRRLPHCMESLKVEDCPRLRNLFTMSLAKSLVQLKYLGLGGCGDMEYIVSIEEEKSEEAEDIIVIPQLVTLYLHKMKKLKSFCHEKHILEWPSLKEFTIEDCKAVEVILGDASCRRLEGSVSMQQPLLLVEKVGFPSMESMKISHMDNMEKIWLDELPSNAFTKLKKLIVECCEKLSSIFSSDSILRRFQNLEELKVTDCDSLEVVFQMQELNMSGSHSMSTFQLRKLELTRLQKMKHVWSGPSCGTSIFEHLWCLKAKNCESLKSLFPVSIAKSMTQLKELLVQDCGVEEIIAVEGGVGTSAGDLFFPQLTDLRLLELPELRRFYWNSHALTWPLLKKLQARHYGKMRLFSVGTTIGQNQPTLLFPFEEVIPNLKGLTLRSEDVIMMTRQHHYVFHNLTELDLACYHDENVTFPSDFLLHRFPDLKELSLSCSSFEEIFPEDTCGHGGATSYGELTYMETPLKALKNLQRLELNKLCKLQRVWKDDSLMAEILKQIETLLVSECSSLSIVLPSPTAFQRLTILEVKDCAGLVHMGTSSAATSLVNLAWLTLRNCGAMEDVVTDDGTGVEEISFPKLCQLTLDGLPSLESFSSVNCTFMFPSLWRIIVKQCPKMNIFCNGALSTPRLRQVRLSYKDYKGRWEGDLNTTIQFLST